jgi:hypothetical protein
MHCGFMKRRLARSDAEVASGAARGLAARSGTALSASPSAGGVPDGWRHYMQVNADRYARQTR